MLKKALSTYPALLIKSTVKKNFSALGRLVKTSKDTISRYLFSSEESCSNMILLAKQHFANKKKITLVVDETFVSKVYSKKMRGSGMFWNTLFGKSMLGYKISKIGASDGKDIMPLGFDYILDKKLVDENEKIESSLDIAKRQILEMVQKFKDKDVYLAVDGGYSCQKMYLWTQENNIKIDSRFAKNRVVIYKGKKTQIRNIKELTPKGRQMARTIYVMWNDIPLYITADRRIDKHENESIVYIASNYKDKPSNHVKAYKRRWPIEKMFRTVKQHLGLKDCYSTKLEIQRNHMAAVFLAYSYVVIERKKRKLKTPEAAIRALEHKKANSLIDSFSPLDHDFNGRHA